MRQNYASTQRYPELSYPSLENLDLMKALQAINQAYAQMTANAGSSESPRLKNSPVVASLQSCLSDAGVRVGEEEIEPGHLPALGNLDRVKVFLAIYDAYLQLADNSRRLDNSPVNSAVLCMLAGCMVDVGHFGFPLPGDVARAA